MGDAHDASFGLFVTTVLRPGSSRTVLYALVRGWALPPRLRLVFLRHLNEKESVNHVSALSICRTRGRRAIDVSPDVPSSPSKKPVVRTLYAGAHVQHVVSHSRLYGTLLCVAEVEI